MERCPPPSPFIFICGADDFLVSRLGKTRYDELAKDITDEFSREIISGFANNVGEVDTAINHFRKSVHTVSMFDGRRVVWLKDVNFLADTVTGRAESTLKLVEAPPQQLLEKINPDGNRRGRHRRTRGSPQRLPQVVRENRRFHPRRRWRWRTTTHWGPARMSLS